MPVKVETSVSGLDRGQQLTADYRVASRSRLANPDNRLAGACGTCHHLTHLLAGAGPPHKSRGCWGPVVIQADNVSAIDLCWNPGNTIIVIFAAGLLAKKYLTLMSCVSGAVDPVPRLFVPIDGHGMPGSCQYRCVIQAVIQ
jgi:hypothetical protein